MPIPPYGIKKLPDISFLNLFGSDSLKLASIGGKLPTALTIAKLYECRWQIELFFKWIKQHLRVKAFYGTFVNAVKPRSGSPFPPMSLFTPPLARRCESRR
jgi:hypothetical protein